MSSSRGALALAFLRFVVGVTYIFHGVPKITAGIEGTAGYLGTLGIPAPLAAAWAIALLETVGGLLLALGILVTPLAVLFILHMLTGIFLVHLPNGWYVIGGGHDGVEFNVLLIAALAVLIFAGPGTAALRGRKRGL